FHFSLSVTLAPSLGGTVTLNPPGGIYEPGTVVELDLEVKAGYSFVHWSEDLAGSVETETVTMDTPKSVTGHLTFDGPVIYVNDDASGANSGVSWGDAFLSLQDGLEAATAGKQIWVAAGTYKPTVKVGGSGHKFKTFQMKNGVAIYGGFVGNEVFGSFDLADRDWNLYEAVLSGDLNGNDIPGDLEGNRSDNCYHIFYHPDGTNLDSSAILDGFTITASNAFGVTHETGFGGGMFNYGCSPTISNCIFRANSAYQGGGMINWENSAPTLNHCRFWGNYGYDLGGGMLNLDNSAPELNYCSFNDNIIEGTSGGGGMCNWDNSAPTLTGCEFSDNLVKEGHGGGMYNGGSSPTLTDCTFTGNTLLGNYDFGGGMNNVNSSPILTGCAFTANTARNCGGIYNIDSSPILTRCMFTANTAGNNSGGMMNLGGAPILVNCGFMGNTAGNCGGGMMIYNNSDPVLVNCTFTGNSAGAKGGGIYMAYSSNLSGYNCVFYGNRAPIGYGVFLYDEGTGINYVRINNSILWDGGDWLWNENDESSVEIVYSDVAGGFAGEGNIEADPNFIDPGYWDPNGTPGNLNDDFWLEGDYRLQGGSPCIDTGSNYLVARDIADLDGNSNTTEAVPYDLAGNPRIADDPEAPGISLFSSIEFPSVDMGAYERPGIMLIPGDINGDGVVNLLDWAILCQHWLEDKS
ncbi:MAG: right-handed parallel beta-helix repeat-containing protein, partial [Planctomycetes bacterium]|nr:right-handed parallel beta-helix repeat-containing protein [Planctomycetota bacterium]